MLRTSRWILRKLVSARRQSAQNKTHAYKLMDSQKIGEYEMTGPQKTDDVYKLMDSQKTREYELTGAQKKLDAYRLMDSQKNS